jgi:Phage gp6-like head-tail connector protein
MGVLSVKTQPTIEPVTIDEAKLHLRVDTSDDDALILGQIKAARRHLEWTYNRAMLTQSLVLTLDSFDSRKWTSEAFYGVSPATWSLGLGVTWSMIELRPPVQSITSVKYTDPSGVQQTLASSGYAFDPGSEQSTGRIFPALNKIWPAVGLTPAAVSIEFVAGFTSADLVPEDWKAATKLMLGALYENREEEVVDIRVASINLKSGLDALMGPYTAVLLR